jgi:hypothetical protein
MIAAIMLIVWHKSESWTELPESRIQHSGSFGYKWLVLFIAAFISRLFVAAPVLAISRLFWH